MSNDKEIFKKPKKGRKAESAKQSENIDAAQLPDKAVNRVAYQEESRLWAGPLPPPEVLEHYNRIIPDGADRILKMAEMQSLHRQAMEKTGLDANIKLANRGQLFAMLLSLTGIISALVCVKLGQPAIAALLAGTTIVILVRLFLKDKSEEQKEPISNPA